MHSRMPITILLYGKAFVTRSRTDTVAWSMLQMSNCAKANAVRRLTILTSHYTFSIITNLFRSTALIWNWIFLRHCLTIFSMDRLINSVCALSLAFTTHIQLSLWVNFVFWFSRSFFQLFCIGCADDFFSSSLQFVSKKIILCILPIEWRKR